MAAADRFVLVELHGFAEGGGRGATSYSILDRYYNWAEIYHRYASHGGADLKRRADCVQRLEAMNARERAWRRQK